MADCRRGQSVKRAENLLPEMMTILDIYQSGERYRALTNLFLADEFGGGTGQPTTVQYA